MNDILQNFSKAYVLVIGDIMLDTYYEGDAQRISPEAPVPVVKIEKTRYLLGGAGNVARNICALGGSSEIISIIGDDFAGKKIDSLLEASGVHSKLIIAKDRPSTIKSRIFARNQQMIRFDEELDSEILEAEKKELLSKIENSIKNKSVIVISDYGKGLLYQNLISDIYKIAKKKNFEKPLILVDPKPINKSYYENAFLLTPNTKESSKLVHMKMSSKEEIISAGKELKKELNIDNLLITLGAQGMALFSEKSIYHVKSTAKQVFDVTGAGDTVIATLATCLSITQDLEKACNLATLAAGIVVEKVGSATANKAELENAIENTEILNEKW